MEIVDLKIKKDRVRKKGGLRFLSLILILGLIIGTGIILAKKGKSWFDPVSIVASVTQAELKETDGRTNILLLGVDNRTNGDIKLDLTDSILVVSIGKVENDVVLISLPRDLWVDNPGGYKSKINEVYQGGGGPAIMKVVENVLGIPMHYYGVIDFYLFKEAIDILGGVEVNVDREFVDYYYPIEGMENAPLEQRYETVKFDQGAQTMNGQTALKYVRSRKGTNGENTDFARSERQQKVIQAVKNKVLSIKTLVNPVKLKELYDLYSEKADTNLTLADLQNFYLLSQQINFDRITSVVLDDRSAAEEGGLLYAPVDTDLYKGAYVLIPKTGDFSQIHAYVQRYLFGAK